MDPISLSQRRSEKILVFLSIKNYYHAVPTYIIPYKIKTCVKDNRDYCIFKHFLLSRKS